jgi:hypothetical protein
VAHVWKPASPGLAGGESPRLEPDWMCHPTGVRRLPPATVRKTTSVADDPPGSPTPPTSAQPLAAPASALVNSPGA